MNKKEIYLEMWKSYHKTDYSEIGMILILILLWYLDYTIGFGILLALFILNIFAIAYKQNKLEEVLR